MSDWSRPDPRDESQPLRNELARMRAEAEQEIARLRGELTAVRKLSEKERDVDSVTEQLALQQELDALRNSLQEKERIADVTAAHCRRLEDELEDQHVAYDGLNQDLERIRTSLKDATEQAAQVKEERQQLEERCDALSSRNGGVSPAEIATAGSSRSIGSAVSLGRFITGSVVGAVLAGISVALWLRPDLISLLVRIIPDTEIAAPADRGEPRVSPAQASVQEHEAQEPEAVEEQSPVAVTLGTVRDRLRSGASGPLMVALLGGELTMGKLRALPHDDEGPAHDVRLGGFLIGATEVTFEEYDQFVRATGGRFPNDFGWGRGQRPVVDVSWSDAQAYVNWLSRQTGQRYRLPSEAEWEYAAAAGSTSAFWWGYRPEPGRAVCFDCGSIWDNRSTAPVGSLEANPLGLYDTAGNALEWTQDCYHPNYVGAPADGQSWDDEKCRFHVARGGAFNKPARSMRTTSRHRFATGTRLNMLGFRLARDE